LIKRYACDHVNISSKLERVYTPNNTNVIEEFVMNTLCKSLYLFSLIFLAIAVHYLSAHTDEIFCQVKQKGICQVCKQEAEIEITKLFLCEEDSVIKSHTCCKACMENIQGPVCPVGGCNGTLMIILLSSYLNIDHVEPSLTTLLLWNHGEPDIF
jgi:hypothetical protein